MRRQSAGFAVGAALANDFHTVPSQHPAAMFPAIGPVNAAALRVAFGAIAVTGICLTGVRQSSRCAIRLRRARGAAG